MAAGNVMLNCNVSFIPTWAPGIVLHNTARHKKRMEFVFKEPATAVGPLIQLNINWTLLSNLHHSLYISHIKIKGKNCGIYHAINFTDQG